MLFKKNKKNARTEGGAMRWSEPITVEEAARYEPIRDQETAFVRIRVQKNRTRNKEKVRRRLFLGSLARL